MFSVTGGQAAPDEPPELVYWPLGGIGDVCQLVTGVYVGKRMVLMERFSVPAWVEVVKTHRLQRVGVQPAVVRMLLEADLPAADLSSLQYVMSASGPLDRRPVTPSSSATASRCSPRTAQRNSPDRCVPGRRISTAEFGARKRAEFRARAARGAGPHHRRRHRCRGADRGSLGILTAKVPLLGPDWVRTHRYRVDRRGRIHHPARPGGRGDQPGRLQDHPGNHSGRSHLTPRGARRRGGRGARRPAGPGAVRGRRDRRGRHRQRSRSARPPCAQALPAHHVPVSVVFVDELPRTPSLKVSVPGVTGLYRPAT